MTAPPPFNKSITAHPPLEICGCLVFTHDQLPQIREKTTEFYNVAPQILVYENGDRYQCVALSELVWMQCVVFFICDWLKRYRQNTAENWPFWSIMALHVAYTATIGKNATHVNWHWENTFYYICSVCYNALLGHCILKL